MRTRANKQSKANEENLGKEITMAAGKESLADFSRESVDKVARRVNGRGSSGTKGNGKQVVVDARITWNELDGGKFKDSLRNNDDETDDIDWEDGSYSILDSVSNHHLGDDGTTAVTVEFSESLDSAKRKPVRRATSEEKELAELVHKVHLLCLLARGRIIDSACDDPLIQASLLSLLPSHLLKTSGVPKLSANALSPLVSWFHNNFHVRSCVSEKRSFQKALAFALETREGNPEEITALFVALFRALKFTTRFVSILDVASIKPNADRFESLSQDNSRMHRGIFNNSTLMVDRTKEVFISPVKSFSCNEKNNMCETSSKLPCKSKDSYPRSNKTHSKDPPDTVEVENQTTDSFLCEAQDKVSESCVSPKCQGSKRKGDLDFEMQMQMAMFATGIASTQSSMRSDVRSSTSDSSNISSPFKRIKTITSEESPSHGISTAVGSQKTGSPLHWAEIYCSGENLTGKWVHVDAVNAIVDGEEKVEAAAAACKTSLRYVVAFAGHGAKDVTRRYCMKWYKIAPQRINSVWWDAVLAPLRELESGATEEGPEVAEKEKIDIESSERNSSVATRNSLEDVELETRALTEPLPTNQQAYKSHQLYAIERWLAKCQILHPRGPILGFCSGHPVYPRACVQTLKTKERWLREGLQVKSSELPAKVLKQSGKLKKVKLSEDDDYDDADSRGTIELYGKWQLEPLQLPHAVNGIVPKDERGQVEVWSEKCLPPGTVHLRLPRVFRVAKRLEIDYAPAMVGFEFKNGRSVPVFEGIVVCAEFKDAILEAYAEEEERRETEEKKIHEAQAISRWYQLLSSIITRQRLKNCYGNSSLQMSGNNKDTNYKSDVHDSSQPHKHTRGCQKEDKQNPESGAPPVVQTEDHEHVFLAEDQSFDEESSVRTKRCHCGFSVQVEEL
ncbi:hypothetical protein P3X46_016157 [Hevea brasiliensis]|uniref:Rad4 beta-hairpin domain-containing protein n=1 Tax=Hevea brasiliensis TaxID=3981 RepID=A0ABQ9M286_HEVBR|nr:DNA repair protein RAD4 isoform X2 [Hevea brasiliensis]KAJ9172973.1 hypothetical protein P3X46_016157 [Hevea brasiliensis]